MDARFAASALEKLLGGLPLTIEFSKDSAGSLLACIMESFVNDKSGKQYDAFFTKPEEQEQVYDFDFRNYRILLLDFETIFQTEMRDAATYFVPRRGIFHTPSLIDRADDAFPEGVRDDIPEKSKVDWKAAGRCLAFNLYSASGFHVTRAVEGVLEIYYQLFCEKESSCTLHGWSDYIKALREVPSKRKPLDKTLVELGQMRKDFRNPLAHPRVVLSETDARVLFDNGESLILAMASEIKDEKS